VVELRAIVYMYAGTWVAKCPRPWCIHADHAGPGPNTGRVGGLTEKTFTCLYCELVCDAVWPDNAEDIVRLLKQRPQVETRNWLPYETIEDLLTENITHGLIDPLSIPAGVIALDGHLAPAVRQLAAVSPLAIGA
jgi:hypothetical protein